MVKSWLSSTLLAVALLTPAAAGAQSTSQPAPDPAAAPAQTPEQKPPAAVGEAATKETRGFLSALAHNLGDDLKHIPRRNSIYWLAGGGAAALAIHPLDDNINAHLAGSAFADKFFAPGQYIGSTYTILGASAATYMLARANKWPRGQHLAMDEIEATLIAEGYTQALKVVVRRDRPIQTDGQQSHTYSFPSGHATLTFAAATVLQQHLGYRAGIPTYLVASYVAMSRLHDNRHFASDVVFGAASGVMIGRSVTWHGRNFYAMPMIVPGGAGIMMAAR